VLWILICKERNFLSDPELEVLGLDPELDFNTDKYNPKMYISFENY
jgi:hypothetical protein